MGTVAHASLSGLEQVDIEIPTVANSDRDAEQTAVFAAAWKELPGSAGSKLPDLQGPRQGLPLTQGEPDWGLSTTVVHLGEYGEKQRDIRRQTTRKQGVERGVNGW